jgi:membrane protease YdiL (CAAX protease family)
MKRLFLVAALAVSAAGLPAQNAERGEEFVTGSRTGDILAADLGAFGGGFAAVGLNFLALWALGADGTTSPGDMALGSAVTELSDIPLFLSGSPDALALSAGSAALLGAEALADWGYQAGSRAQNYLYWGKIDLTMYKSYNAYASLRLKSDAWDNSSFNRCGALDLMTAPLDPKQYMKPQPWIALGMGLVSVAASTAVLRPELWNQAVWSTGRYYRGEEETTAGAFYLETAALSAIDAAYTGMGEESVYRGVMHEELAIRLGKTLAYGIDTGAFLAMHLFTDMARGYSWQEIGMHLGFVAAGNLLFDWAYDEGGLPLAVTCHALTDFAVFVFQSMLTEGVPRTGT